MVHGNGLSMPTARRRRAERDRGRRPGSTSSAVLMGSKAVGLYLEVAAGFDAILGLDPFYLGGKIYVRGELRLWIVGISASAELDRDVGRVAQSADRRQSRTSTARSAAASTSSSSRSRAASSLTIGRSRRPPTPDPRPLVAGVTWSSPVAGAAGGNRRRTGRSTASWATRPTTAPAARARRVPLDAIPVIAFSHRSDRERHIVLGSGRPWHVGSRRQPVGAPRRPLVALRAGQDVEVDGSLTAALARRRARGGPRPAGRTRRRSRHWRCSTGCRPRSPRRALRRGADRTGRAPLGHGLRRAAPPAHVLWTFDHRPVGSSPAGWRLDGVPWPDPSGCPAIQPRCRPSRRPRAVAHRRRHRPNPGDPAGHRHRRCGAVLSRPAGELRIADEGLADGSAADLQ